MKNKKKLFLLVQLLNTSFLIAGSLANQHSLRPVPWVTHEAVLFLQRFMKEHPNAKILEFGMGSSTVWFAKYTKYLTSVEHHPGWYNEIAGMLAEIDKCNPVNLILHERPYYTVCNQFPDETFDLILVDGRNRSGCIKYALSKLKSGGVLMLDNSERPYYQKALKLMKGWKGIQAVQRVPDSCGFMYKGWRTDWYFKPLGSDSSKQ